MGSLIEVKKIMIRLALTGIVFISVFIHSAGYVDWQLLTKIENVFYDARLLSFMPETIDNKIVIIDIDEKSLLEQGQWPWPRDKLAKLVNNLFDYYEVISLGFDAVFAEPDDNSALNLLNKIKLTKPDILDTVTFNNLQQQYNTDQQFSESLIARNAVLGFVFKQKRNKTTLMTSGLLPSPLITSQILGPAAKHIHTPVGYTANLAQLQNAAMFSGFFDYVSEQDILRKVPLIQQYNNQLYPSLSLELTRLSLNQPPIEFILSEDSQILEQINLGDIKMPVDKTGSIFIPFRGYLGSFEYISASDVINQTLPVDALQNKILLLGTSAAGLLDLRSTPVGDSFIGVEVHANIVSAILEKRFLHQPDYVLGIELSILLTFSLIMTLIFPKLDPTFEFFVYILLCFIHIIVNLWFWYYHQLVLPMASPLILLTGCAFMHISYNFFIEQKHKRHLSKVFSHYIPQELVKDFDVNEAQMSLIGETREMSVLFTDVRNFTSMSEKMHATELTKLMNEFLTPITRAIHDQHGTIDKYMGDAVMAFWGAPVKDKDHAKHAILTALNIIKAMDDISIAFKKKGWPQIKVGIGISSGPMNVGNMGSEFRIAYTVMGDTVNLGSRLEGLTKIYGVDIIVNETTTQLADDFAYRVLDKVRVKGKLEPITIYEPMRLTNKKNFNIYHQALALYWQQDFSKAKAHFRELFEAEEHPLYQLYIKRCEKFELTSPEQHWDGVFTYTSK